MTQTTTDVVHNLPVLTDQECREIRARIMELRPEWLQRNPYVPFYTLGAASYMDAARSPAAYQELARKYNPVLEENFAALYRAVAGKLSEQLQAPVDYARHLALPGFHIYLSSKVFEKPVASIHCDSQYSLHDWSGMDADLSRPISFTLSIALPKNGGGLNTWNLTFPELAGLSQQEITELTRRRDQSYHPYRTGHLALHSGHIMHQAAPGRDVQPEDERITLQGHGIRAAGVWRLYW